jgi:hypothetical protein
MRIEPYSLPHGPHTRRHGPGGYTDYGTYKEWLRDEFQFRCVFCLHREKWERRGWRAFRIDHIIPQSIDEAKICDYDNLLYTCDACNEFKSDWVIPDPCKHGYSSHYRFEEDGTVVALSDFGKMYIDVLKLDTPYLVTYRRDFLNAIKDFEEAAAELDEEDLTEGLERWFGYPDDIPDLRPLRPKNNSRPDGKHQTYFMKLQGGLISSVY